MSNDNPYSPPASGVASASGKKIDLGHEDQADLFVQSLPPILLKAAVFVQMLASAFMILFAMRLWLAVYQNGLAILLELAHLAVGIAGFFIARGLTRGSMTAWIAGLVVCPISAIASLFALLTGSVGGLFCGGLSVASLVLIAVNHESVKRIAVARKALRDAGIRA